MTPCNRCVRLLLDYVIAGNQVIELKRQRPTGAGSFPEMKTPTQRDYAAPAAWNDCRRARRPLILSLWGVLLGCVVIGSMLPAASPVMVEIGSFHINDKVLHFGAYLALSLLPVIGFRDRRRGLMAGLSMFLLGILMEAGQHFSPGRAVELGDVLANSAGVSCGTLLGLPIRTLIAIL